MSKQKAVVIKPNVSPKAEKWSSICFGVFGISFMLIYGGKGMYKSSVASLVDSNAFTIVVVATMLIFGLATMYLTLVREHYTEEGFIIVDDDHIETYLAGTSIETIKRTETSNVSLEIIEPSEAKLNFIFQGRNYSFHLLFDRVQRLNEFHSRFPK
jgi:hypothetical protein